MKRYFTRTKESALIIPAKPSLGGWFKLTAIRPDGRERPLTDWFPNLITDGGLNRIGTGGFLTNCHVGSGTVAPATTDTALQTFVANKTNALSSSSAAQASPPYYGSFTRTFRFDEGTAAGNLSEVGVGWGATASGPLFSRALIVDALGDPTTITVLADEVLDVSYQLRLYPPLTDTVVAVTDSGPDATIHTVTVRASNVTSSGSNNTFGWSPDGNSTTLSPVQLGQFFSGAIGSITGQPSGSTFNVSSSQVFQSAYSNNSLEVVGGYSIGLTNANFGGIESLRFPARGLGVYQAGFDPIIPKDDTKVLTVNFKVSWGRHTP